MQVLYLGRAPRTKETLLDFLKWRRVTRPPLAFRGLTGSQRTPGFWGVTGAPTMPSLQFSKETMDTILDDEFVTSRDGGFRRFLVK